MVSELFYLQRRVASWNVVDRHFFETETLCFVVGRNQILQRLFVSASYLKGCKEKYGNLYVDVTCFETDRMITQEWQCRFIRIYLNIKPGLRFHGKTVEKKEKGKESADNLEVDCTDHHSLPQNRGGSTESQGWSNSSACINPNKEVSLDGITRISMCSCSSPHYVCMPMSIVSCPEVRPCVLMLCQYSIVCAT
jgi:hypothetical protein